MPEDEENGKREDASVLRGTTSKDDTSKREENM